MTLALTPGWFHRLVARPGFQRLAARLPIARHFARRDGAGLFDLVQGFVRAQVLLALVELDLPRRLLAGPESVETLARFAALPPDRMQILCQAGAGIGLLRRLKGGRFGLARQGAALIGVPGLSEMIRHHGAFYRDMSDPVALLRGDIETELAGVWPYVFGGSAPPEVAARYSDLMAQSQRLVAQDTLAQISLTGVSRLLDVGGGTGVFLDEVHRVADGVERVLFDLPEVVAGCTDASITVVAGSFRTDALPKGADAISLIRVLYDHDDETVMRVLCKVFEALPYGGRIIISEPMSGGTRPDPHTDVYFAFYTLAMRTGRCRSAQELGQMLRQAGFGQPQMPRSQRPFVTSVLSAVKPG
jgi:demethylspheroidene O-methyltransferase